MGTELDLTYKIQKEVLSLLGPIKDVPSGWKKQNCKLCHHRGHGHDKRERFGLRIEGDGTVIAHCFNCGFGASWSPGKSFSTQFKWFLKTIGMTEHDIKRIDFELYKFRSNMEGSSDLEIFKDITKQWKEKPLPKGARTIAEWAEKGCTDKNFIEVVQYLADRKLLYPNDFYWTPNDKMYVQRAIMPFIYDGKIVGHTGRLVRDAKKFKYMADTPKEFIAGLDAQQEHDKKYVILCEGIFDAYVTDGIAALGNELNAHQISIINRLNKEVIVVPDRDEAGQNLFDIALREGWSISTPEWGKGIKDPAQAAEKYGRILTIQSIIKSSNKNAFTAKVKRKMDKA